MREEETETAETGITAAETTRIKTEASVRTAAETETACAWRAVL